MSMTRHIQLTTSLFLSLSLSLSASLVGCADNALPEDPIDESFLGGGKEDTVFGIKDPSYAAYGVLALANRYDAELLREATGCTIRVARAVEGNRPRGGYRTLAQLDAVPYTGRGFFKAILAEARESGLPSCGDEVIQPGLETCDGNNGCRDTCRRDGEPLIPTTTVHAFMNGGYDALTVLNAANLLNADELARDDFDPSLAQAVYAHRPYATLEQLDAVDGVDALELVELLQIGLQWDFDPHCGDADVQPVVESCDDSNAWEGDGCTPQCEAEASTCGNGVREGIERCDGGAGCANDCTFAAHPHWEGAALNGSRLIYGARSVGPYLYDVWTIQLDRRSRVYVDARMCSAVDAYPNSKALAANWHLPCLNHADDGSIRIGADVEYPDQNMAAGLRRTNPQDAGAWDLAVDRDPGTYDLVFKAGAYNRGQIYVARIEIVPL